MIGSDPANSEKQNFTVVNRLCYSHGGDVPHFFVSQHLKNHPSELQQPASTARSRNFNAQAAFAFFWHDKAAAENALPYCF
jgi:hypothetical protein